MPKVTIQQFEWWEVDLQVWTHTPDVNEVFYENREITEQQLWEVMNAHRSDVKDIIIKLLYCT